jgi:hypothetical protein
MVTASGLPGAGTQLGITSAVMRIDWNQTLLGHDGRIFAGATGESPETRALGPALAGRMAGLLAAVLFLAVLVVLAPLRPELGWRMGDLIPISGLLVLQVLAFALLRRAPRSGLVFFAPMALLQVLLVVGLGAPLPVVAGAGLLILCELVGLHLLFAGRSLSARGLFALGLAGVAGGLFAGNGHGPLAFLVIGMAVPALTMLALAPASAPVALEITPPADRPAEPFSDHAGLVLAVNSTGMLATDLDGVHQDRLSAAARWPHASLIDALLVIDRPALLQALSRAIQDGAATPGLVLRLRQDNHASDGRFVERALSVEPAPGYPGLALVALGAEIEAGAPIDDPTPARADPALVQRALHDVVAPFNASLGYLELIADPRLAPRDLASYRHYAEQARAAMLEAHRNTALMSRWLKLLALPAGSEREPVDMVRLAQDAARFVLAAEGSEGRVTVRGEPGEAPAQLSAEAARFAIAVLLRAALQENAGHKLEISISTLGSDIRIRLSRADGGPLATGREDMFQMALEQAAMTASRARFGADETERCVTFRGVATAAKPARQGKTKSRIEPGRLAS